MEVETPIGLSWAEYYRSLGVVGLFVVVASLGSCPAWRSSIRSSGVAFLVLFGLSTGYQLWQNAGRYCGCFDRRGPAETLAWLSPTGR